jgi:hypothetical protein
MKVTPRQSNNTLFFHCSQLKGPTVLPNHGNENLTTCMNLDDDGGEHENKARSSVSSGATHLRLSITRAKQGEIHAALWVNSVSQQTLTRFELFTSSRMINQGINFNPSRQRQADDDTWPARVPDRLMFLSPSPSVTWQFGCAGGPA